MTDTKYSKIFDINGPISSFLKNYEFRQGQVDMAAAIEDAIHNCSNILIEAGTGIGKSFAYLIPFINWAVSNNKKVVIATYTKALQEQLFKKDIAFLKKALGNNFNAALCFGSENYLCKQRLSRSSQHGLFETKTDSEIMQQISEWASTTKTGLLTDMPFEPPANIWLKICRDSNVCRNKKCHNFKSCFYVKAKKLWGKADILIANHHVFFSNLDSDRSNLPEFHAVVFDEAHNLENVAADFFGINISNNQLRFLLDELLHPKYRNGFLSSIEHLKDKTELGVLVNSVRQAADLLFTEVENRLGNSSSLRIIEPQQFSNQVCLNINELIDAIYDGINKIDDDDKEEIKNHLSKLKTWSNEFNDFLSQKHDRHVYWIEKEQKSMKSKYMFCASPIDVAPYLKDVLFNKAMPVVLTSATLSVNNSFAFFKERLGVLDAQELLIQSPFDFKKQVILYTPHDIPDPNIERTRYTDALSRHIKQLVEITNGRTFILFTSYETLKQTYKILEQVLLDYSLLKHGDLPRWQLLERFKKEKKAVLFGTSTFWQGIDIPGRSLESVIITRLPFAVPDHPLLAAKIAHLEAQGINAFMSYQVPQAVLLFKQGFGRLIRNSADFGLVSILDPRIKTRHYGRLFINSLPKCQYVTNFNELAAEYKKMIDSPGKTK